MIQEWKKSTSNGAPPVETASTRTAAAAYAASPEFLAYPTPPYIKDEPLRAATEYPYNHPAYAVYQDPLLHPYAAHHMAAAAVSSTGAIPVSGTNGRDGSNTGSSGGGTGTGTGSGRRKKKAANAAAAAAVAAANSGAVGGSSPGGLNQGLTRDERKAMGLSLPISVSDIINLPMDEFNDLLSKHDLSEEQLTLCRDIRRRGKNKVGTYFASRSSTLNCLTRRVTRISGGREKLPQEENRPN